MTRQILVTGATGAIGSYAAWECLRNPNNRLCLILRASSDAQLATRFSAVRSFWDSIGPLENVKDRVEIARGDLELPSLGLDANIHERWTLSVSHIIHAAGNVKLNQPLEEARRATATATQNVLQFAKRCMETHTFQRLAYLSTVGVAGRLRGLIPEKRIDEARPFHNTYESAKAEAETIVLAAMESGVPVTIFRPSMVVGDSTAGRIIHFQVFYFLAAFLTGQRTAGILPHFGDVRLDIIPADYVARAIVAALDPPEANGRIFHLCSGPHHAIALNELADQLRALKKTEGQSLPALRFVSSRWIRAAIAVMRFLLPAKQRRALGTLPYFLDYLEENQTFDNAQANAFFSPLGISIPAVPSYIGRLFEYYRKEKNYA